MRTVALGDALSQTLAPESTWPFWAPSKAEAVEAALDVAEVGPGDRFVDLGCGDGQVLVAAARRGATVAGVEYDPSLVAQARQHLADEGFAGDIAVGDLFDPDLALHGDVFFTYLAPASLQRLWPTLESHRGVRVVSVDFDIPGRIPTKRNGAARLYRVPGRRRRVGDLGWESAGTLIATVPDCHSLSCLALTHPGGRVRASASASFGPHVAVLAGTEWAGVDGEACPTDVAIDLRWEPMDEGTLLGGTIRVTGAAPHPVFVFATDHDEEGVWELSDDGVANLTRALRRRNRPDSIAAILAAAEE